MIKYLKNDFNHIFSETAEYTYQIFKDYFKGFQHSCIDSECNCDVETFDST